MKKYITKDIWQFFREIDSNCLNRASIHPTKKHSKGKTTAIFHQYISNICKIQLILKKLLPLKPILVFTTRGQKCIVSVLQLFEMENFDLGHPVDNFRFKIDFT